MIDELRTRNDDAVIADLLTTPCTITRASPDGPKDAYGQPTETTSVTTTTCWIEQFVNRERGTDQVDFDRWHLYLPAGTAIDSTDRVAVAGVTYQVEGTPWSVTHPRTGAVHHVEVEIIRAG